jgi:hypothetical protein
VAALVIKKFFLVLGSEDENPIRVRNKQLRIETYERNWIKTGGIEKWKMNNANPTASTQFTVFAYGANAGCIDPMTSTTVEIRYAIPSASGNPEVRTLSFSLELNPAGKPIPILTPSVPLAADNSKRRKILSMTDDKLGAITEVTVGPKTCTFPSDRRVEVELCLHNCS